MSGKAEAWALFDHIIGLNSAEGYSNPWQVDGHDVVYVPDFAVLEKLLAVPLFLNSMSRSGVPALALDVWTAYEFRRAGFEPDRVWPRAAHPRIMPSTLIELLNGSTQAQRKVLEKIIESKKAFGGETAASANLLGKNYVKQVDVVMSSWSTGPEIMVSTKRMDSSFGNNSANRVEESYGDAKNLRARYPQAALGFVYSLNHAAFEMKSSRVTDWIVDLLGKLGREDDAYDAVALIVPDWSDNDQVSSVVEPAGDDEPEGDKPLVAAGVESLPEDEDDIPLNLPRDELDGKINSMPTVRVRRDVVPDHLSPDSFFKRMVDRVLDNSPVTYHQDARRRRSSPVPE
ncbi:hypothetical protein [Amycolatopsis panacis]|uniref:Uncharacterized protein n=1 Tax=Amycolatopsis panacis TaxID=2340917 RepID=A0A419HT51_9PSEU|nr:hypothetical protein [Amycolatopsis panacis]RJQ79870.1 hypothetical protein D5S19_25415 [Amycolatopsis panacis]